MASESITISKEEYERLKEYEKIVKGEFSEEFIESVKKSREEYMSGKARKSYNVEELDEYFENIVNG